MQEIKTHEAEVASKGIMSIPNFIKIGKMIQKLVWETHSKTS